MKTLFLAAGLLFAASAFAQQYKWVDPADGRVRYGDQPPVGVKATPLRAVPPGPAPAAAEKKGDKPALSPEAAFRKRQDDAKKEADAEARTKQAAAAKQETCNRARANLRALESGERIARIDSKGERYYLEDAEIAQETARQRQEVQRVCG